MRRIILGAAVLAAAAALFCGCEKEQDYNRSKKQSGNAVSFSVSDAETRTVYDDNNIRQINWVAGDKIDVFCQEAEDAKQAEYEVVYNSEQNKHFMQPTSDNVLQWGGDSDIHNFYAVYPSGAATVDADGKATFSVNYLQTCTVTSNDAASSASGNVTLKKYTAAPDMSNAYMVAKTTTAPTDMVGLSFKPIMTTLNILVKGTRASTEDDNTEFSLITPEYTKKTYISAVSVIKEKSRSSYKNSFVYDLSNRTMSAESGDEVYQEYKVNLVDARNPNNPKNGITLESVYERHVFSASEDNWTLDAVMITVFLPPFAINADSGDEDDIKIRVYGEGMKYAEVTVNPSSTIGAGSISQISLAELKREKDLTTIDYARWISQIKNDDILVSQLSIPGSHQSAANTGTVQTQDKTIAQQFDAGVRVFDFQTAVRKEEVGSRTITRTRTGTRTRTRTRTRATMWSDWRSWSSWGRWGDYQWNNNNNVSVDRWNEGAGNWPDFTEDFSDYSFLNQDLYNYYDQNKLSKLSDDISSVLDKVKVSNSGEFAIVLLRRNSVLTSNESPTTNPQTPIENLLDEQSSKVDSDLNTIQTRETETETETRTQTQIKTQYQTRYVKGTEEEWQAEMAAYLQSLTAADSPYKDNIYTGPFRSDLTIGELRNKVLFITLDQYNASSPIGAFAAGYESNFASDDFFINPDWNATSQSAGGAAAKVQDVQMANNSVKQNHFQSMLQTSASTLFDESTKDHWFINHASAFTPSTASTSAYQSFARNNFADYFTKLSGMVGSTGIVMFDWAGSTTQGANGSNGKKGNDLVQEVIKNNYKYVHKERTNN